MAAPRKSRIKVSAEPDNSALAATRPGARAAVLSVRLWTADAATAPDPQFWSGASPAIWLVSDLITASDGVPAATHDRVLVASFTNVHAALAAARRIQWAIQGFSETPGLQGTAVAILVQSTEATPGQGDDEAFLRPLEQAAQGQILLTEETCLLLDDLPGFSLQATTGNAVRELLWRAPESESERSHDEASLAQLIQQHPVEEHIDISIPAEPEAAPAPEPARQVDRIAIPPSSLTRGKSPLLIGGVCAVVLILAVAVFIGRSSKPSQPAAATSAATDTTKAAAVAPSGTTVTDTPSTAAKPPEQPQVKEPGKKETAKEKREREKREKKEAAESKNSAAAITPPKIKDEERPPERPTRDCDYDLSDIPGVLDGAESALARGKYSDAARQFRAALACEPHNGRAQSGLERVKRAQEAGR
jgi:hypothetical protein